MEGETDRREDGDSPEGRSDILEDLRNEIRRRYPDSATNATREARPDSERGSAHLDGVRDTKLEENDSKSGQSKEQSNPQSRSEEKFEPEGPSYLEQLRYKVRERYPESKTSEGERNGGSDRVLVKNDEDAEGPNSQIGRKSEEDKRQTVSGEADSGSAILRQHDGKSAVAGEDSKHPFSGDGNMGASQPYSENDLKVESAPRETGTDTLEKVVTESLQTEFKNRLDSAIVEIADGEGLSNRQSRTEVAPAGETLRDRQADSQENTGGQVDTLPHSRAGTDAVDAVKPGGNLQDGNDREPPERRHTVHTESGKPLFTANESKVGRAHYLHIPQEHMPKTENADVLEARVARSSAPEIEYRLYTSSTFKEQHIYISPLSPARHESFNVMSLEHYGLSDFVRNFNERKPNGFANVALSHLDGKIMLRVDKSEVEVLQPKLTSDGSRAILHGTLVGDDRGGIRIAKQFETHRLDFADLHASITQMKGLGDRIEISYRLSAKESHLHVHQVNARQIAPLGEGAARGIVENRLLELDRSRMSREEIRAWIDTEGHIYSAPPGEGGPQIRVSQKYREPLETFVMGVKEFGVRCIITTDKRTGQYIAVIADTMGVAKVISEVGPFRAPQRREQVRRLIEHLKMERKERRRVIERALKLLEA